MYTKGAEGVLLPTLPVTMAQPCYKPLCPDALGDPLKSCKPMGGRNAKGRLPNKPAPIATGIELPARTRKTNRPTLKVSTVGDASNAWAGERIEPS